MFFLLCDAYEMSNNALATWFVFFSHCSCLCCRGFHLSYLLVARGNGTARDMVNIVVELVWLGVLCQLTSDLCALEVDGERVVLDLQVVCYALEGAL